MKFLLFTLLLALAFAEDYPKDNDVTILTEEDFDDFIKGHQHVLVKFFVNIPIHKFFLNI